MTEGYRARPRNAPDLANYQTAVLAISVDAPAHEGAKLGAAVNFIRGHFAQTVVDVSDTLQRWNHFGMSGMSMEYAAGLAERRGTAWIGRNEELLATLPGPARIVRWNYWLEHPDFAATRDRFEALYQTSPVFQQAVERDAAAFIARRTVPSAAQRDRMLDNSRNFIVEEAAAHTLLAREFGPLAKIYPGHSLETLALLRARAVPGAPGGMEREYYVRFTLDRVGAPSLRSTKAALTP
jgi:tRNA-dependent cyclodipeptide synthase